MSEIDRQLEADWRKVSREEPMAAADASIRAAARRAVAAHPEGAKPANWWRARTHWVPLAATAVMAVLAVGLVQLTPPEQVNPSLTVERSTEPRVVEEAAAGRATPKESTNPTPARAGDGSSAQVRSQERAEQIERKRTAQAANEAKEQKSAPLAAPAPPAERQPAAKSVTAPATPSEAEASEARKPRAALAQAFPAAPQSDLNGGRAIAAPGTPARGEAVAAAQDAATLKSPSPPAAPALQSGESESREKSETTTAGAPQPGTANLAASDRLASRDMTTRSADEWIKLIRKLRAEGKSEEAAKELAEFRAAYRERAQSLLPADLRDIKP